MYQKNDILIQINAYHLFKRLPVMLNFLMIILKKNTMKLFSFYLQNLYLFQTLFYQMYILFLYCLIFLR